MSHLHQKYTVSKTSGEPVDQLAQYFVLRVDTDPAARAAVLAYANCIDDSQFARELREWVMALAQQPNPVVQATGDTAAQNSDGQASA